MPTASAYKRKKYGKKYTSKKKFPLSEIRRRKVLADALKRTFSIAGDVKRFVDYVYEHPFMEAILMSTAERLSDRCGNGIRIILDLFTQHGKEFLMVCVESDATPTETVNLLDGIEDDWKNSVTDVLDAVRFDIQTFR